MVEEGAQRPLVPEEVAQQPSRRARNPVAAIDCGTNTIKLLVGVHHDDELDVLERETRMVRLGQGVDATGRLTDEALGRTFAAIEEYAALVERHRVRSSRIRFCATSATRDASNAADFRAGVVERLGVGPEVLTGDEEADLAFAGALRGLADDVAFPVLVVDIGGGSTELILGDRSGVRIAHSLDIGSVRLHERHLHHDPPADPEIEAVVADVDAALDGCRVPLGEAADVVGIAGTMTTLGAAVLDLPAYDRDAIDGSVHAVPDVHAAVDRLVAMTVAERKALPYLHPGRADVIDAGLLIADRVLRRTPVTSLRISESDILEGIAWSIR